MQENSLKDVQRQEKSLQNVYDLGQKVQGHGKNSAFALILYVQSESWYYRLHWTYLNKT